MTRISASSLNSIGQRQSNLIWLFPLGVSLVLTAAFASLIPQWRGLLGENGLLPANAFVKNVIDYHKSESTNPHQSAAWSAVMAIGSAVPLAETFGFTIQAFCSMLACVGFSSSIMVSAIYWFHLCGIKPSILSNISRVIAAVLLMMSGLCYGSLVHVGQTFYSFQWDMLLLECVFLASLGQFYASFSSDSPRINVWAMRFLAWKLMFLSGVVKLQARCPTWDGLSALEYHFATQCIPTPLAWIAHQMPPILLRFGVAMTLLIEIHLTFLLIMPFDVMRIWGAWLQILLQIAIILTGNYNFFNMLTIILMFPSLLRDYSFQQERQSYPSISTIFTRDGPFAAYHQILKYMNTAISCRMVLHLLTLVFIGFSMYSSIAIDYDRLRSNEWWRGDNIRWILSFDTLQSWIMPSSVFAVCLCLVQVISVSTHIISSKSQGFMVSAISSLWTLFHAIVIIGWILLASVGLQGICNFTSVLPEFIPQVYSHVQPLGIFNSYGLFRRMTGVGPTIKSSEIPGLDILSVQRPELVIEAQHPNTNQWIEVEFKYKPGALDKQPPMIAPYQPRLDWQMWFAALGSYSQNPWLVNLAFKLLKPENIEYIEVINLLDESYLNNFRNIAPKQVRIRQYNYDFTRWDYYSWNVIHHEAVLVNASAGNSNDWWYRKDVRDYLPALDVKNPSLKSYLEHYGIFSNKYISLEESVKQCFERSNNSPSSIPFVTDIVCNSPLWLSFIAKQLDSMIDNYFVLMWTILTILGFHILFSKQN